MTPSPRRPPSTMGSEQRIPLQFPLIPPLPHSNSYGKENQRQSEAQSRTNPTDSLKKTAHRSGSSPSHTPQSRTALSRQPLSVNRRASADGASPAQLLPRRFSQGGKRRVLRYGETVESLFLLTEQTSAEHRRLCQDIVEGPLSDDASSWLRAIQAASQRVAKNQDIGEQGVFKILFAIRSTVSSFSSLFVRNAMSPYFKL